RRRRVQNVPTQTTQSDCKGKGTVSRFGVVLDESSEKHRCRVRDDVRHVHLLNTTVVVAHLNEDVALQTWTVLHFTQRKSASVSFGGLFESLDTGWFLAHTNPLILVY